jgi:hypothetical protein
VPAVILHPQTIRKYEQARVEQLTKAMIEAQATVAMESQRAERLLMQQLATPLPLKGMTLLRRVRQAARLRRALRRLQTLREQREQSLAKLEQARRRIRSMIRFRTR